MIYYIVLHYINYIVLKYTVSYFIVSNHARSY